MTARELADRFMMDPFTPVQVAKLRGAALRFKIELADIVKLLPADVQAQIEGI